MFREKAATCIDAITVSLSLSLSQILRWFWLLKSLSCQKAASSPPPFSVAQTLLFPFNHPFALPATITMAAMSASSTSVITNDGPVLTLINKRLRALRKKLNRISQMEESLSKGKTLNKEQEETLRSKSAIVAGIDELEKLRIPLSEALNQEIQIVLENNKQMPEAHSEDRVDGEENVKRDADDETVSALSDLLSLVYFGSIFDVQTLLMAQEIALMRTHERNCCLTYDYVTDDDAAGDPLKDWDLDLIAMMGSLVISRPIDSCLSHKNALQKCVEHAKLWLANSEQPIEPNSSVTYAGLREKLRKIMASEYFTTTPEMKAPIEVAAAVSNFTPFQVPVPVHASGIPDFDFTVPFEGFAAEFEQEEEAAASFSGNDNYDDETGLLQEFLQVQFVGKQCFLFFKAKPQGR